MVSTFIQRLLYGEPYKLGYVQSGMGIAKRRVRFSGHWNTHIAHTKEVQQRWFSTVPGDVRSLGVLGAGRLYDFCLDIPTQINQLAFYDADPTCKRIWRRFAKQHPRFNVQFHCVELSGKIYSWAERARKILDTLNRQQWDSALLELSQIHLKPITGTKGKALFTIDAQALISLNILSQIPIQWQMWVEQMLKRKFGKKLVEEREADWLKAIYSGCAQLVREHLMLLAGSGARSVLLITDLDYVEYRLPRESRRGHPENTVLYWKRKADSTDGLSGNWERIPETPLGASANVYDSLYGVLVADQNYLTTLLPGIKITPLAVWTWHIVPQFTESSEHGYLHRVGALCWSRL